MSKTSQIKKLLRQGKHTPQEIALCVGTSDAYVRAVKQRMNGVDHTADYKRRMYTIAQNRPGAREFAREHHTKVYREAIKSGLSTAKAASKAGSAYSRAMIKYVVNNSTPSA